MVFLCCCTQTRLLSSRADGQIGWYGGRSERAKQVPQNLMNKSCEMKTFLRVTSWQQYQCKKSHALFCSPCAVPSTNICAPNQTKELMQLTTPIFVTFCWIACSGFPPQSMSLHSYTNTGAGRWAGWEILCESNCQQALSTQGLPWVWHISSHPFLGPGRWQHWKDRQENLCTGHTEF